MKILIIDDQPEVWCGNPVQHRYGLLADLKRALNKYEPANVSVVAIDGTERFVLQHFPEAPVFQCYVRDPEVVGAIGVLQQLEQGSLSETHLSDWLAENAFDFYVFDYAWDNTKVPAYKNQEARFFLAQLDNRELLDVSQAVIVTGNTQQRDEMKAGVSSGTFKRFSKENMMGVARAIQEASNVPCRRGLRSKELNSILNHPDSGVYKFFHGLSFTREELSKAIDRLGELTKKEPALLPLCKSILSSKWGVCTWTRENPNLATVPLEFHSGFNTGKDDCELLASFLESKSAETPAFLQSVKCSPDASAKVCRLLRKVRPPAMAASIRRVIFPRMRSVEGEWFRNVFEACVPSTLSVVWDDNSLGGISVDGPKGDVLIGENANNATPKAAVPLVWYADFLEGTFFSDLVKAVEHPVIVASMFAVKAEPRARCFVIRCEASEFSLEDFGSNCQSQFQDAARYTMVFAAARIDRAVVLHEILPGERTVRRRTPTLQIGALSVGFENLHRGAAWLFAVPTI